MGKMMDKLFHKSSEKMSAKDVAEKTYGEGAVGPLLNKKFRKYVELKEDLPILVEQMLPSYRMERWRKELPIRRGKNALSLIRQGIGSSNVSGLYSDREIGVAHNPTVETEKRILDHEFVHDLQRYKKRGEAGTTPIEWLDPRSRPPVSADGSRMTDPVEETLPEYKQKAIKTTRNFGEIPAYMTEVIRGYKRITGNDVNSKEDVYKALDTMINDLETTEFDAEVYRLLKEKKYIGSLGQMLVRNREKKKGFNV